MLDLQRLESSHYNPSHKKIAQALWLGKCYLRNNNKIWLIYFFYLFFREKVKCSKIVIVIVADVKTWVFVYLRPYVVNNPFVLFLEYFYELGQYDLDLIIFIKSHNTTFLIVRLLVYFLHCKDTDIFQYYQFYFVKKCENTEKIIRKTCTFHFFYYIKSNKINRIPESDE